MIKREPPRLRAVEAVEEWVGGRFELPIYVQQPSPARPHVLFWADAHRDLVIGVDIISPNTPPRALGEFLEQTMRAPAVGEPRRPQRIRVPTAAEAKSLRETIDDHVEIIHGPCPELIKIRDNLVNHLQHNPLPNAAPPSYLEDGRIAPEVVGGFFSAAAACYAHAPWKRLYDRQILRIGIRRWHIQDHIGSIIGALGESYGCLVFKSIQDYAAFSAMGQYCQQQNLPPQLPDGLSFLAINFDAGADLAPALRREVARYHWPVANARAYPSIMAIDGNGGHRPLCTDDYTRGQAYCLGLHRFFTLYRDQLHHDIATAPRQIRYRATEFVDVPTITVTGPYGGSAS